MSRLEDRRKARDPKARDGLKVLHGARAPLVAAVDLGASKVSCFIMKPEGVRRADRTVNVAGVGYVQSKGVRGGTIVDMEDAGRAIAQAVERAEAMAGVSVAGVTVATAGGQLSSCRVNASVSLGPRPIGDDDLTRTISSALTQVRTPGRRAIHVLPTGWSVDGARGIRDPRNMFGKALGLDLLVVTMNESAFNTLGHCLELAHLEFQGVVAAPFASALAALMQRVRSSSMIGRAPRVTLAWTRVLESLPPAVTTVTPETLTPAAASARSTAWAIACAASSMLMMEAPRTPLEAT